MKSTTLLLHLMALMSFHTSLCFAENLPEGPSIYVRSSSSVLLIKVYGVKADGTVDGATGSGFLVSSQGDVLTAKHVLLDSSLYKQTIITAQVGPQAAKSKLMTLEFVKSHDKYDLALLRVIGSHQSLDALPIRRKVLQVGEMLYVMGFPLGLPNAHILDGIVSDLDQSAITTNALVEKGNSGGPVLDSRGCAIGVVFGGISETEQGPVNGLKFAVPISSLNDFLPLVSQPAKERQTSKEITDIIHVTDVLSRTQSIHQLSYTTQKYRDVVAARVGYRFSSVESVGLISLNPPELTYPSPVISPDGKEMVFEYSLISGPLYDRKRGWIEMTINTSQRRIDDAVSTDNSAICE